MENTAFETVFVNLPAGTDPFVENDSHLFDEVESVDVVCQNGDTYRISVDEHGLKVLLIDKSLLRR